MIEVEGFIVLNSLHYAVQCDCGWGFRTNDAAEVVDRCDSHEAETGHPYRITHLEIAA